MDRTLLQIGPSQINCEVAQTSREHITGLSRHASLGADEGMLFTFGLVRHATMHMADVPFDIDIIGVREGFVTQLVERAEPGSLEHWHFYRVSEIVEVPGGWCRRNRVKVGSPVTEREADLYDPPGAMMEQVREREDGPGGAEQFGDRDFEYFGKNNPDSVEHFHEQDSNDIVHEPGQLGTQIYPNKTRMSGSKVALIDVWDDDDDLDVGEIPGTPQLRVAQIVDEQKFVEKVAEVIVGNLGRMQWIPDHLNGDATERSVVTRCELGQWLEGRLPSEALQHILDASATERGLNLVGDAFILAGVADSARVAFQGGKTALVLRRMLK